MAKSDVFIKRDLQFFAYLLANKRSKISLFMSSLRRGAYAPVARGKRRAEVLLKRKSDTASAKCGISAGSDLISVRVLPIIDFCQSDKNHRPALGVILGRKSKLHLASVDLSQALRSRTAKMSFPSKAAEPMTRPSMERSPRAGEPLATLKNPPGLRRRQPADSRCSCQTVPAASLMIPSSVSIGPV